MKKELQKTIKELEEQIKKKKEDPTLIEDTLTKIHFFQHERLVHLIVTFMTGVSSILFLIGFELTDSLPLLLLFLITLLLFIPYIFFYYHLENGTQKLYELYFKLKNKKD